MYVKVNGDTREIKNEKNLADLLQELSVVQLEGVAVALNHRVVRRDHFETTKLSEGDEIEIVRAVQGG